MSKKQPSDRIFVEEKTIEIYKMLNASAVKNSTIKDQPFTEAKELFMWAVSLGFHFGKRLEIRGKREGLFFWNRLSKDIELPILQALAIFETANVNTIRDEAQIQLIAEEYANFGIRKITSHLTVLARHEYINKYE